MRAGTYEITEEEANRILDLENGEFILQATVRLANINQRLQELLDEGDDGSSEEYNELLLEGVTVLVSLIENKPQG